MKCTMFLVLLALSLLASIEGDINRGKRNEVDLNTGGASLSREKIDQALKNAEAVMEAAIKKVEDPSASLDEEAGEVKVPVRSTPDAGKAKKKRSGFIHIRIIGMD